MPYFSEGFVSGGVRRSISENILSIQNNPKEIAFRDRAVRWLFCRLSDIFYARLWAQEKVGREDVNALLDGKADEADKQRISQALKRAMHLSGRKGAVLDGYVTYGDAAFRTWFEETLRQVLLLEFQQAETAIPIATWKRFTDCTAYTEKKTADCIIDKLQTMQGETVADRAAQRADFENLLHKKQYLHTAAMSKEIKERLQNITDFLAQALISQEAWSDFCGDVRPTSQTVLLMLCIGMRFGVEESKQFLAGCHSGFSIYRDTVLQAAMDYAEKTGGMDLNGYHRFLAEILAAFHVADGFPALRNEYA